MDASSTPTLKIGDRVRGIPTHRPGVVVSEPYGHALIYVSVMWDDDELVDDMLIGAVERDYLYGICWPMGTGGDVSLPWVERDDEVDMYGDDKDAANEVARLVGGRVMWAEVAGGLSPFVMLPGMDYNPDRRYDDDLFIQLAYNRIKSMQKED